MSSGIVQLTAVGSQNEQITGNPEVSYFVSSYKRHSNFSQSLEEQTIQGAVNSGSSSKIRFDKTGDLLGYVYLCISQNGEAKDSPDWTSLIKSASLLIGGHVIDKQSSDFCEKIAIDTMATNTSRSANGAHGGKSTRSYFYPFRFFNCENPQSAIPLCALSYHEVEIIVEWGASAADYEWECHANFYYLEEEERVKLASEPQNILIQQVQQNPASGEKIQELYFNHPVKYIASTNTTLSSALTSPSNKIKLSINGTDIGVMKYAKPHYIDVSSYYHTEHVTTPDFFMYPFCLKTHSLQPTGTLNFSRLNSVKLWSENLDIDDDIFAVNYNILRINNGMAGILYAN